MYRRQTIKHSRTRTVLCLSGTALALSLISSTVAEAQTSSYQSATDNVQINWDALNGGSSTAPVQSSAVPYGMMPVPASRDGLLMPGLTPPHSMLHVAPLGGSETVQLRNPTEKPKVAAQSRTPAPAPAMAQAPKPKPAAPAIAAPKQLAEKKAPTPAPTSSVNAAPPPPPMVASAPPPPPMPTGAAPAAPVIPAAGKQKTASAAPAAPEQASKSPENPADDMVKVIFNNDDTKLSADGQSALESVLAKLADSEKLRVQLMAYAAGSDLTSSKARRISLSRALSVRSYLIEKGVRSTRIDVRALGDKGEGEPRNRVDVNMIER